MKVMGRGHAATTVGDTLIVFDAEAFQTRGGDLGRAHFVAEHGTVEVPDEIAERLLLVGMASKVAPAPDAEPDGDEPKVKKVVKRATDAESPD